LDETKRLKEILEVVFDLLSDYNVEEKKDFIEGINFMKEKLDRK
jgi:hypothetical protein